MRNIQREIKLRAHRKVAGWLIGTVILILLKWLLPSWTWFSYLVYVLFTAFWTYINVCYRFERSIQKEEEESIIERAEDKYRGYIGLAFICWLISPGIYDLYIWISQSQIMDTGQLLAVIIYGSNILVFALFLLNFRNLGYLPNQPNFCRKFRNILTR